MVKIVLFYLELIIDYHLILQIHSLPSSEDSGGCNLLYTTQKLNIVL